MLHFFTVIICLVPVLSHPGPLKKTEWISTAQCSLKLGKELWEPCAVGSASIDVNQSDRVLNETWMFPGPVEVKRTPFSATVSFPRVQPSNITTLHRTEQGVIYILLTQDSEDKWYCLDKSSENHLQVNIPIPRNAVVLAVGRSGLLTEHDVSSQLSVGSDPAIYIGVAVLISLILLLIGICLVALAVYRPDDDAPTGGRRRACSCLRLYLKLIHRKFGQHHGTACDADSGLPMLRRLLTEREIASVPRSQNPQRTNSLPSVWLPPGAMSPQQPKLRTAMSDPDIRGTAWNGDSAPGAQLLAQSNPRLDTYTEENKSWMARVYSIEINLKADVDLSLEDMLEDMLEDREPSPAISAATPDSSPAHCSHMSVDPLATSTCQVPRIHNSLVQVAAAQPSPVQCVRPQVLKFSDLEAPMHFNIAGLDTTIPANQTGTSDVSIPTSPPMPTYPPPPLPSDVNANDISVCSTKTEHLDSEVADIMKHEYSTLPSGANSSMTADYVPLLLPHQVVVNADVHFTEPEMESECMEERLIVNLHELSETETMA